MHSNVILLGTLVVGLPIIFGRIRIPQNPCPTVFSYYKRPGNGEIYGEALIPYDGANKLEFTVNASLVGYFNKADLRLHLATPTHQIKKSTALTYNIFFPFTNIIPKMTQIKYNNRIYCSGPPEPLIPGAPGVTNVWASHIYSFNTFSNREIENSNNIIPQNDPEVDTSDVDVPIKDPNSPSLSSNFQENNPFLSPQKATSPSPAVTKETHLETKYSRQNKECGVSKNVIVPLVLGGQETTDGLFPWIAAMFVFSQGNSYEYKCTANLISDRHVVTAARCVQFFKVQIVKTEDILFVFGRSDISHWATNGAVTRSAIRVQTHPEYDSKTAHSDISVITLDKPIEFSDTIAPICLWEDSSDLREVINKKGTVAGWGMDEGGQKKQKLSVAKAKYIDLPVVSQEDCLYSNFTFGTLTTENTFCAGSRDGKGPCIGDSGAGFMMNKNGKYYLRGLVSLALTNSEKNCDLNNFVIFCDAAKCKDWIDSCLKN